MKPHLSYREEKDKNRRIKDYRMYDIDIAHYKQKKSELESTPDTISRYELQMIIIEGVRRGLSAEKIKEILSSRDEFSKFANYFDSYIQHAINKANSGKNTTLFESAYSPAVKSYQSALKNAKKELNDREER